MTESKNENPGIVYSTELGRICPVCGNPASECVCRRQKTINRSDGIVRVGRETKGRRGKGVTVITGVPLDFDGIRKLAKQFKQTCGSGGTVKEGVIEIQGDHRERLAEELKNLGYKVKRSGS
ncbi:MAG TPA: translation initiation factor Sui1 [Spirochaetes bacterium]|nr:translation initiation factor Sui1 [Spirochaetota bacterium]